MAEIEHLDGLSLAHDNKKHRQPPLYHRIKETLRKRIQDGHWKSGEAIPNRNILTAEFRTTRITLDKAIQQLVDEGVLTSTRGSGTYVASQTRNNKGKDKSTYVIGIYLGSYIPLGVDLLDTDTDRVYFSPVLSGISAGIVGQPVVVRYTNIKSSEYLDYYNRENLDGLIILTTTTDDLPELHRLMDNDVPFVTIGASSSDDQLLPAIEATNRVGGEAAARHLMDLGHRQIACVNLATTHANQRERLEGLMNTLKSAGFPIDPDLILTNQEYDVDRFDILIDEWLERLTVARKLPTAIFACDFNMTLATLGALRRRYLVVPNDISLIGFDDPLSAAHLSPPLTTIRQPAYNIGIRAAQRLMNALINSEPLRGTEYVETEVIVRRSTCPPRITS